MRSRGEHNDVKVVDRNAKLERETGARSIKSV